MDYKLWTENYGLKTSTPFHYFYQNYPFMKLLKLTSYLLVWALGITHAQSQPRSLRELKNPALLNLTNSPYYYAKGILYSNKIGDPSLRFASFTLLQCKGDSFAFVMQSNSGNTHYTFQIDTNKFVINAFEKDSSFSYFKAESNEQLSTDKHSNRVKLILGKFLDTAYSVYQMAQKDTVIFGISCREFGSEPSKDAYSQTLVSAHYVSWKDSIYRGYQTIDVVDNTDTLIKGSFIQEMHRDPQFVREQYRRLYQEAHQKTLDYAQVPIGSSYVYDSSLYTGKVPALMAYDIGKKDSTLLQFKGKYLVEFWYMGCWPCINAFPHIKDLEDKYAAKGIQFLKVNTLDAKNEPANLFNFCQKKNILPHSYTMARPSGSYFGVNKYPTFLFIQDGSILHTFEGFNAEVLERMREVLEGW